MAGYTRNDTPNNIADGNVINASDLDGEFDAIQTAFSTGGHTHDGTAGNGPQIGTGGIANDAVTLGTKTSGNYVAAGAVSGVGLSGSASAEGATFTVTSNATNANTASTIVARDASGNFNAGTVTAALSGNASTATALQTARTIAGQSFDGTANITIASTDLSDSGSINATTLDSLDSTQFLRSDTADTKTSGDLSFADNVKANFGASSDLQIYHNSSNGHSIIAESGTGSLFIDATDLQLRNSAGQIYANATSGGSIVLRHAGNSKLATTSTGATVTGELLADTVDATTLQIGNTSVTATAAELNYNDITTLGTVQASKTVTADASGNVLFSDNDVLEFGTGSDFRLFHDGAISYIRHQGLNDLYIENTTNDKDVFILTDNGSGGTTTYLQADGSDGTLKLFYYGSQKLATKTDGVDITGELQADSLDIDGNADISGTLTMGGNVDLQDNDKLMIGTGDDLQIYHSGSFSIIYNTHPSNLFLASQGFTFWNQALTEIMLNAVQDGAVTLYYNGSSKLATNTGGVTVTGTVTADGLVMGDDEEIQIGNSTDLRIYHDSVNGNSVIRDAGAGNLRIMADDFQVTNANATNNLIFANDATGEVTLYHNGNAKIATTSTGVTVTGRSVGGTPTPENDGSFDLSANNDFTCTTTTTTQITFTNAAAGQSGNIKFVNGGNHTISADTMVAINASVLSTLSVSGTYHLAYYVTADSGADTILVSASAALT